MKQPNESGIVIHALLLRQIFPRVAGGLLVIVIALVWVTGGGLGLVSTAVAGQVDTPAADPGYRVGPEDVLLISVWKDAQLTREVVVRPDGMISFPLVGDVPADGRTVEELRTDLVARLAKYIPSANVSIAVTKVLSYKVYIMGRVTKPGEYLIGHYTDVLQALSLAGGLAPSAAENDIKIIRRVKGTQQIFIFRYADVQHGRSLEQNILLQRGDIVMVPRDTTWPFQGTQEP